MKEKLNKLVLLLLLILTSVLLIYCGGGGGGSTPPVSPVDLGNITPLYSTNGADWNDYVEDDGSDTYSATDTPCDAASSSACFHGGEMRLIELSGVTSCFGITASDSLSAFNWTCDSSTGSARIISTGLKDGKGLSDLLDLSGPTWKNNRVTVYSGANIYGTSTSSAWWTNPLVTNNVGGALAVAETLYVVTADTANSFSLDADSLSLVAAPGIVISGSITGTKDFTWIEDIFVDASGYYTGVSFSGRFSRLQGIRSENADFMPNPSSFPSGIILSGSNNTIYDISASNTTYGIRFNGGSNNTFSGITANYNAYGLLISTGLTPYFNNSFSNVNTSCNEYGVYMGYNSTLSDVTANNNKVAGLFFNTSSNNTISGVTASNNEQIGIFIRESADNNTLSNITVSNNGDGILIARASNNTFSGITASNNSTGIRLVDSSENYFTEYLQVGSNWHDCDISSTGPITNPGLDDDSDPSDQGNDTVHDYTCIQEGASDFGTAVTGITLGSSFVGKISLDDSENTSDTGGSAIITNTSSFDWTNFENPYRTWGTNGTGMLGCSDMIYSNQTDCETNSETWRNDARIWDWSLVASGSVIRNVLSLPTGNDTHTHTWYDASTSIFLRNADEIDDDGVGNNNTLCETGESCLFMPNMGSYQGHGSLTSAGIIGTGGTIENVTLWKYDTNGF